MKKHILEVDSVIKDIGINRVLSDVYLKCETGEVVGILGRNGSGKSTLLKIIFGSESSGNKSIRIDGKQHKRPLTAGKTIAYLPQHDFLPANQSIKRIINTCISNPERRARVIQHEKITPILNKKPHELSAGETRYTEILLLVNLNVEFVLLDEPFSGLEPIYRNSIGELIAEFRKEKGFIITDHVYRNVIDISDRIVLLLNGRTRNITNKQELIDLNYLPPEHQVPSGLPGNAAEELQFEIDQQTGRDIDLYDNGNQRSIFSIFKNTKTRGGEEALDKMFQHPLQKKELLEERRDAIKFFQKESIHLDIERHRIEFIERYLSQRRGIRSRNIFSSWRYFIRNRFRPTNQYHFIISGIKHTTDLLKYLHALAYRIQSSPSPLLTRLSSEIQQIISSKDTSAIIHLNIDLSYPPLNISTYDFLYRQKLSGNLRILLDILYQLDALESVARTAAKYHLSYPEYLPGPDSNIYFRGLFHPLIQNPVANDFGIRQDKNFCFLTGANMSGKSTFSKSFSLAIFLAHLGFPVPAARMETTLFNGLITSINLSDNVQQGYSHFFSEVKRVKEAALQIRNRKKMVIVFDELFRGTNVKDASEASLMIASGFAQIRNSVFIISTHIVEIAAGLGDYSNISFKCFASTLEKDVPLYDYLLKDGVSQDHVGLQIVKNEKIMEILREALSGEANDINHASRQ